MKTCSHYQKLHYHTWRDIGGPIGFVLDVGFCGFVLVTASLMIVLCTVLVFLDYLASPVLTLASRFRTRSTL